MSTPTLPLQIKLENELKKRINENDVSKGDLEFYQRKIRRVENELAISQDEVNKLRVKLKRAEDFELKYEMLFKQSTDLKNDNESKTKQINTLLTLNDHLKITLEQKSSHIKDFSLEKENLLEQIAKQKERYESLQHQSKIDLEDERIRSQQTIKQHEGRIRSEYKERQEDMQYEIHQLKKVIQEKQTVEQIINQRVDKIRNQKDEEIDRLKGILEQKRQSYENYMRQKNEELQRMKEKFQKMINFDIENLKSNQQDQQEIFGIQLNGLREMIGLKNDEIQNLLGEIDRMGRQHEENRKELLEEVNILKEKIYTVEKDADIELNNLKDRLIMLHAQDSKAMEDRYEKIVDTLKEQMDDTKNYVKELERMQQNAKQEFERNKIDFHERLKEKDKRIHELLGNMRERGELNASQLKSLHESFHLISSQKEIMTSQYQGNLTFLNQQIIKLNSISEIKTKQITKLHEELHTIKISYEQKLADCESKFRKERKEKEEEREQERIQRDKLNERIQDQDRELKNQAKRMQRERERLEREKAKAQYMLEQAEKDIERLNKYIKQLDDSLKAEFKKSQLNILDKDSLRREIISELERQKIELQALKLMQIDQMRKKYEMENTRLTTMNEQLKTQILNKTIAFENLESEFKKLDYKNRNADKFQKDKIKQYEQKMLTLTQQIGITQNLYQAFLQAKARAER